MNTGIGEAACVELARMGARLIMACRSRQRGDQARSRILEMAGRSEDDYDVIVKTLDTSSMTSVRKFADDIIKSENR